MSGGRYRAPGEILDERALVVCALRVPKDIAQRLTSQALARGMTRSRLGALLLMQALEKGLPARLPRGGVVPLRRG